MPYGYIPDQSFITPNILPRRSNRRPSGNFVDTYQMTPQQAQSAAQLLPNTGQINHGYVPQNTQFARPPAPAISRARSAAESAMIGSAPSLSNSWMKRGSAGGVTGGYQGGELNADRARQREIDQASVEAYDAKMQEYLANRERARQQRLEMYGMTGPEAQSNMATQISGIDANGNPAYGSVSTGDARMAGQEALAMQRNQEANMMSGDLGSRMATLQENRAAADARDAAYYPTAVERSRNAQIRSDLFRKKMEEQGLSTAEMDSRRQEYIAKTKDRKTEWQRRKERRGGVDYMPQRGGPMVPGRGNVAMGDVTEPANRYPSASQIPVSTAENDTPESIRNKQFDVWAAGVFDDWMTSKDKAAAWEKIGNSSVEELKKLRDYYDNMSDRMWKAAGWTDAEIDNRTSFVDGLNDLIRDFESGGETQPKSGSKGQPSRQKAPPSLPYQPDGQFDAQSMSGVVPFGGGYIGNVYGF